MTLPKVLNFDTWKFYVGSWKHSMSLTIKASAEATRWEPERTRGHKCPFCVTIQLDTQYSKASINSALINIKYLSAILKKKGNIVKVCKPPISQRVGKESKRVKVQHKRVTSLIFTLKQIFHHFFKAKQSREKKVDIEATCVLKYSASDQAPQK